MELMQLDGGHVSPILPFMAALFVVVCIGTVVMVIAHGCEISEAEARARAREGEGRKAHSESSSEDL